MPGLDGRHKGPARKCVFCIDRVSNGLLPACAKTCPAGAYQVGERDEMIAVGRAKVAALRAKGRPNAYLYGENELGGLGVMFVLADRPSLYGLPESPRAATKNALGQWLSGLLTAGMLAAVPFWMLHKRKNELASSQGGE